MTFSNKSPNHTEFDGLAEKKKKKNGEDDNDTSIRYIKQKTPVIYFVG
jgi:hypothetical protein